MEKQKIKLSDHFDYDRLIRFTLPSVMMMVISSVYSIVDGLFISNFAGSDGFAAVNLIMPVTMLVSCIGFMGGTGGSALISKTLGEKRDDEARDQFSLIIYAVLALAVIIGTVVFIFVPLIPDVMGAEGVIREYCIIYGRILVPALPFFMLQILFQNFLVVAERPKMGMVIAISSGVTNIVLDALFVAVFKWGVAGAAAATVIGQSIGGIIPLVYFIMKKNHLLWFTKAKWNGFTIKKTAANGFADFINNASVSLIGIVFNKVLMQNIGSDGVVAYGIVMYVNYIATGIFMGYSVGIAPIYGYNLGAENYDEIKNLFKKSMTVLAAFAVLLVVLFKVFADGLAAIFVNYDDGLMKLTTNAIRLYSWSFMLCWFNIHAGAMFVALNNGPVSSVLSFTRTLVFQLGSVLLLPIIIGTDGIWLSITLAEMLAAAVSVAALLRNREKYQYI